MFCSVTKTKQNLFTVEVKTFNVKQILKPSLMEDKVFATVSTLLLQSSVLAALNANFDTNLEF